LILTKETTAERVGRSPKNLIGLPGPCKHVHGTKHPTTVRHDDHLMWGRQIGTLTISSKLGRCAFPTKLSLLSPKVARPKYDLREVPRQQPLVGNPQIQL